MQPEPPSTAARAETASLPGLTRGVAWYGVAVLSVVQLFSFIDRQALSLLIAPIKAEFGMSDVQVSLLIGLGFALAYAVAGLPIGRLVDQWSRPLLLGLGLTLWSVSTAACGVARSFGQLALFRSGVGIGEATLTPTVISFLGDYFPPSKRGISFGVFAVSVYVGSGLSLVAGSAVIRALGTVAFVSVPVLGDVKPWQLVFLLIGLPGLLVVPLVLTLFEPRRRGAAAKAVAGQDLSIGEVLAHYRRHWPAFLTQHAASTMMAMLFYGVSAWIPEFLRRTYDNVRGYHGLGSFEAINLDSLFDAVPDGEGTLIYGFFGSVAASSRDRERFNAMISDRCPGAHHCSWDATSAQVYRDGRCEYEPYDKVPVIDESSSDE